MSLSLVLLVATAYSGDPSSIFDPSFAENQPYNMTPKTQ
jgi:hypothetical protein